MRHLSRAAQKLADAANDRGARIAGAKLTAVQVDDWDESGAFEGKIWRHQGRPVGGSDTVYPEGALDIVVALAQALDQKPHSFDRAALVVAGNHVDIGTTALKTALKTTYKQLRKALYTARSNRRRLRFPSGILAGRFNSLARNTIFELVLDEVPLAEGLDDLVEVMGLPAELRTFPPDPVAADYPGYLEILRQALSLDALRDEVFRASREDLDWACAGMRTVVLYAVALAKFVDITDSSTLPVLPDPDPAVAASGQHVMNTVTASGRALNRLLKWAGSGSTEWLAAFAAPMVLRMLRILPARARSDMGTLVEQADRQLPILLAGISLARIVPPELRRFLGTNGLELLEGSSEEERAALRSEIMNWSASHAEQASWLAAGASRAAGAFGRAEADPWVNETQA